jgi:hypothetical protein
MRSAVSRAINALSRIGDDLYIEPTADGLTMRSTSLAGDAYGEFTFAQVYFDEFDVNIVPSTVASTTNGGDTSQSNANNTLYTKVGMKAALRVFKPAAMIERKLERAAITLDAAMDVLVVEYETLMRECVGRCPRTQI